MDPCDLRTGECYRLRTGQTVRVLAVIWQKVYCEAFHAESGRWELIPTAVSPTSFSEWCACPG